MKKSYIGNFPRDRAFDLIGPITILAPQGKLNILTNFDEFRPN